MRGPFVLSVGLITMVSGGAIGANVITNGGFETGNFNGWTVNTLLGSNGSITVSNLASGAALPIGPAPAAGPAGGSWYAMVDQGGPGGYEIFQSFNVAANSTVTYSFDLFGNDSSSSSPLNPTFFGQGGLTAEAAQYVRVDILDSVGTEIVNLALIGSPQAYLNFNGDISALLAAGGTFTFRFRHFDNQFFYHSAIDNVMIDVAQVIPLPTGAGLAAAGLGLVGLRRRR